MLLVGREHEEQHWRFHSPAPLAAPVDRSRDYPVVGLTEPGYIFLRTGRSTVCIESHGIPFVIFLPALLIARAQSMQDEGLTG